MISVVLMLALAEVSSQSVAKEIVKPCTLWASAQSLRACQDATFKKEKAAMSAALAKDRLSRDTLRIATETADGACKAATVLELTPGMAVEVSANPDVCIDENPAPPKGLIRVRVKDGKSAGTIGCVRAEDLRDPVPF